MRRRPTLLTAALLCAGVALAQASLSHEEFTRRLVAAAVARSQVKVQYAGEYVAIPYPGGDVPAGTGACTDEIIRIYRVLGVDLQQEVIEDMRQNPGAYSLHRRPDANIDHRRVPNLMIFFQRHGTKLTTRHNAADYLPGDIVAWELGSGHTHIGMVVDRKPLLGERYEVLHNIGAGPQIEDVLFSFKIIGHYRYYGPSQ